jgi:hypothetical protein
VINRPGQESVRAVQFELHFQSLSREGRGLVFPCDAGGRVDMDALSDEARKSYLYARAVIGCEFSRPIVTASDAC